MNINEIHASLKKKITKKNNKTLSKIKDNVVELMHISSNNNNELRNLKLQNLLDDKDVIFSGDYFIEIKNKDFKTYNSINNMFKGFFLSDNIIQEENEYLIKTAIVKDQNKNTNIFIVVENLNTKEEKRNIINNYEEKVSLNRPYKKILELIFDENYNENELKDFLNICLDDNMDFSKNIIENTIIKQSLKIKEIINKNTKTIKNNFNKK